MATGIVYNRFNYLEPWWQQHSFYTTSKTFQIHPTPVTVAILSLVIAFKDSAATQDSFGLRQSATYSFVAESSLLPSFARKVCENSSTLVTGGDDGALSKVIQASA